MPKPPKKVNKPNSKYLIGVYSRHGPKKVKSYKLLHTFPLFSL